ncbi:MAG TPA: glutamate--tRNA ligase [Terriglobales bacterium]|nr:glutamate--tRNA ligase [Terriglobales bacterium]
MTSRPTVRVRFAPSPTGLLHVGNARTALFNWLFARQEKGANILRIEDTDVERSEARHETQLIEDLRWLGMDWDEGPDVGGNLGPYRQSDRMEIYHRYAEQLLDEHKAYLCFCTAEELERERKHAAEQHLPQVYSGKCRALDPGEGKRRRAGGEPAAIRLKIPEHPIRFHDIVRGDVTFESESVSDPIIVRSSGMPVYNYVVVVDDALMKITHVIRGDDHLSNTPKQVALYEALGFAVPEFAHLSTILGPDRERLSKRHGATSIAQFREMGILPEALVNYLALLGWAPTGGTRETFTLKELIKEFSLERVTPSPAIFDFEKLYWLNRHYLKSADQQRVATLSLPYFQAARLVSENPGADEQEWLNKIIGLLVPYVNRLDEISEKSNFLFRYDAQTAIAKEDNRPLLQSEAGQKVVAAFAKKVQASSNGFSAESFKSIINEVKNETGTKGKDLFHPVRIVVTGSHSGPDFDRVIPLIETGSRLVLPQHVMSVRERVSAFQSAWGRP